LAWSRSCAAWRFMPIRLGMGNSVRVVPVDDGAVIDGTPLGLAVTVEVAVTVTVTVTVGCGLAVMAVQPEADSRSRSADARRLPCLMDRFYRDNDGSACE